MVAPFSTDPEVAFFWGGGGKGEEPLLVKKKAKKIKERTGSNQKKNKEGPMLRGGEFLASNKGPLDKGAATKNIFGQVLGKLYLQPGCF